MKLSPGGHCSRIIEELEHLVFNEDIPLVEIRIILWAVQSATTKALGSIEDRLIKERRSKNGKEN